MSDKVEKCICGRKPEVVRGDVNSFVRCSSDNCWTGPLRPHTDAIQAWNRVMEAAAKEQKGGDS